MGSKLVSFIPLIGETASSAIDFLSETIDTTKIEVGADHIVKYAPSVSSFEQFMKYIVINGLMDAKKSDSILNSAEEETKKWY